MLATIKISHVSFGQYLVACLNVVQVEGIVSVEGDTFGFTVTACPMHGDRWRCLNCAIKTLKITPQHGVLFTDLINGILQTTSNALQALSIQANTQVAGAATLAISNTTERILKAPIHPISYRIELLKVRDTRWADLWDLIEARFRFDRSFRVNGFDDVSVSVAMKHLQKLFTATWVKSRHTRSCSNDEQAHMGSEIFPEPSSGWFPAFHLAKTATGALCVDPGWNYLIEIGLAIEQLKGYQGASALFEKLSNYPGTQHHVCLAAELHTRGHLLALEPPTHSGSATNDLLAAVHGSTYAIEVKEFQARKPAKKLKRELQRKNERLPDSPRHPVVFSVVLSQEHTGASVDKSVFLKTVEKLAGSIPDKISAIVVSDRFVDSNGGRVKRELLGIIPNPSARVAANASDLEVLFRSNFHTVVYPCFHLASFVWMRTRKSS